MSLNTQQAAKLGQIMEEAAIRFMAFSDHQFAPEFKDCVGIEFWKAFDINEQSQLMQELYIMLCEMGFTPLRSHQ
jgi:hypothetical protein